VSAAWLVAAPSGDTLYDAAVSLFALQIAGLAAATGWTVRALTWAGRHKKGMSKQRQLSYKRTGCPCSAAW
jgi:hypothetical protein